MTVGQNIVFRLIGLFIFFAPKTGANFMADVTIRVNERLAAERETEPRGVTHLLVYWPAVVPLCWLASIVGRRA